MSKDFETAMETVDRRMEERENTIRLAASRASEKVRAARVEVMTVRKWLASKAVTEAESRLRHKVIVGTVAEGRQGLGTSKLEQGERSRETKCCSTRDQEYRGEN